MDIQKILNENEINASYFVNPSYDSAIIGITQDDRVVYSYSGIVRYLIEIEGFTEDEAIDWIEFNVIPTIPYMGELKPVIVYDIEMFQ